MGRVFDGVRAINTTPHCSVGGKTLAPNITGTLGMTFTHHIDICKITRQQQNEYTQQQNTRHQLSTHTPNTRHRQHKSHRHASVLCRKHTHTKHLSAERRRHRRLDCVMHCTAAVTISATQLAAKCVRCNCQRVCNYIVVSCVLRQQCVRNFEADANSTHAEQQRPRKRRGARICRAVAVSRLHTYDI